MKRCNHYLLIAALAGGLTACGGKTEAGTEPAPTAEEQEALDQVPTAEEADAAAAEQINADNLDEEVDKMMKEDG